MYIDVRDKKKRLELAEYLEKEGFKIDKERIADSVLPISLNFLDKTVDRIGDVKKASEILKSNKTKSIDEFYECYQNRGIKIEEGTRFGYTEEDLNYYYGEWIENPLEGVDLSQDKGEPDFDEDDPGIRASIWANSDFRKHAKKMELKDFPNKNEYANYLTSLRGLVLYACHGMLDSLVYFSNDNWADD
jgi:hypothetical protein